LVHLEGRPVSAAQLRRAEPATKGLRRVVRRLTRKALAALDAGGKPPPDEAVHEARKRLKQVRAALRLLREALGSRTYSRENAGFRDAARPLTQLRDAKVLVDTLDELVENAGAEANGRAVNRVRRALERNHHEVRRGVDEGDLLGSVRTALEAAQKRVEDWRPGRGGWSVLGPGLRRVYRNGRDAFAIAQADPSVQNLHEWRKQVKYLWRQLQTLEPIEPAAVGLLVEKAHQLGDWLGDDHDLAFLRDKLRELPARTLGQAARDALNGLIDRRRTALQSQAEDLGRSLYQEKPKGLVRRLRDHWRAWRAGSA
jgi:CHAD domain-containing protein